MLEPDARLEAKAELERRPALDQLSPSRSLTRPRTLPGQLNPGGLTALAMSAAKQTGLSVDERTIQKLRLSANIFGLTLSAESSGTLGLLRQGLEKWESTVGDAQGVMMPRHLLNLPSPLAEVVRAIKQLKGGGSLPIADAAQAMPQAMVRLFRAHKNRTEGPLKDLFQALSLEALAELGRRYQASVVEKKGAAGGAIAAPSAYGFFVAHSIDTAARARLQQALPALFPVVEASSPTLDLDPKKKAALSLAWKQQVVTGQISARRFYADNGLTDHLMSILRQDAAAFPPVPRRGGLRQGRYLANTEANAKIVGDFLRKEVQADILVRQAEICARFNRHPELGKKLGEIDENMVAKLRAFPGRVPPMPSSEERLKALLPEVKQAAQHKGVHSLDTLLAKLRQKHPGIKRNWLDRLREAFGEEVPRFERKPGPRGTRQVARTERTQLERPVRITLPLQRLAELVVAAAPPGATAPMLNAVLDQELKSRGYPGLPPSHLQISEFRFLEEAQPQAEGLRQINARRVGELVTEYIQAGPKGKCFEQVLADVRRDYPHIERRELNAYARIWASQPGRYPLIAALAEGKEVPRTKPSAPRYLGGWDFARWAAAADPLELAKIEGLTQFTRIPRQLDLVDQISRDYGSQYKLSNSRLFWVTHLKADIAPLARAFLEAGLKASDAAVVSSPYGNSDAVRETLADLGLPVTVPPLDQAGYAETVKKRLAAFLEETPFPPTRSLIVVDDGGLVSAALYEKDSPFAKWRPYVRIVEQTTGGVELADHKDLEGPLIMAARSDSKEYESKLIAAAVVSKIDRRLEASAGQLKGKNVTIVGGGFIGRALSLHLAEQGWKVSLAEKNAVRAEEVVAASGGVVKHVPLESSLKNADLVIGATSGGTSLPMSMLSLLKDGAVIASASSRRREIDMDGLAKASSQQETLPEPFPHALLPDRVYTLKNRRITVLGDGWPINHDGDAEGIPPRRFQVTDAVLLAGVFQASTLESGTKGPLPLDPKMDSEILGSYQRLEKEDKVGGLESFDPRRYLDIASSIAGRFVLPEQKSPGVSAKDVIAAVAKDFGMSTEVLLKGSNRDESLARGVAVHLVRRFSGLSLSELSAEFGGRTNSALIYADRQTAVRAEGDKRLAAKVGRIAAAWSQEPPGRS